MCIVTKRQYLNATQTWHNRRRRMLTTILDFNETSGTQQGPENSHCTETRLFGCSKVGWQLIQAAFIIFPQPKEIRVLKTASQLESSCAETSSSVYVCFIYVKSLATLANRNVKTHFVRLLVHRIAGSQKMPQSTAAVGPIKKKKRKINFPCKHDFLQ